MKDTIKDFITEFLSEMIEDNAAIFAGAGLSIPAGYVDWRELIRPLALELKLNIDWEHDLVAVAQFHTNANGYNRHKLHKAVVEKLSPNKPPTQNHELLARLPIRTYWTTNYDKLIEDGLRNRGKVVDVKIATPQMAMTRPGRDATVYKMHGDVDRPDEAVVTRDDYEQYQRDRGAFITALQGDLVSKTFLFLGFSFSDPNLDHVLTRVRLTFQQNQRRHFAVFKERTKLPKETEEQFQHFKIRQALVIEDLKRYNVKVLLVDEYSEITEFLTELLNRYQRRTVFVSGSYVTHNPWDVVKSITFANVLGRELINKGSRIATGLGSGIGDPLFSGALRAVMASKMKIEDALVLRPFPQDADAALWESYRHEILSHAGIALFLFGSKKVDDKIVVADGVIREFELARSQGLLLLPVGATGHAAAILADIILSNESEFRPELGNEAFELVRKLNEPAELEDLVAPIAEGIARLQGGNQT